MSTENDVEISEKLQRARRFVSALPHCSVLKMTVEQAGEDWLEIRLPFQPGLVGNPVNGAIHGGSLTTLMDTACGTATVIALPGFELCPTLDLRVDYMKSATSHQDFIAHAKVTHAASNVVFTDCEVRQSSDNSVIAKCCGTFMRIGAFMDDHNRKAGQGG